MDNSSGTAQQTKKPKISIGVPVYNEEKYISSTLDSILQQNLSNCEIIIADNASEDNTGQIVRTYVEKYPFMRYVRHDFNRGSTQNWNFLIRESKGEYLVFAGAHDLWSENYIEKLSEALDRKPNAVLASGITQWIDEEGNMINRPVSFIDTSGLSVYLRIHQCFYMDPAAIYGMFRLDSLKKTRLAKEVYGCDLILLTELSFIGDFIVVPNVIWFRRENRQQEDYEMTIIRQYKMVFSKSTRPIFPHWRVVWTFLAMLFYVELDIPLRRKIILYFSFILNVLIKFSSSLFYDLRHRYE